MQCPVNYCLVLDREGLAKVARQIGLSANELDPSPKASSGASTIHLDNEETGHSICVVYLRTDSPNFGTPTGVEIVGILAHEAVHVWQAAMETIGELKPSSEFQAYSIQSIVQSLCQNYYDQMAQKST